MGNWWQNNSVVLSLCKYIAPNIYFCLLQLVLLTGCNQLLSHISAHGGSVSVHIWRVVGQGLVSACPVQLLVSPVVTGF